MRATQLIKELKKKIEEVGDLKVKIDSVGGQFASDFEVESYKDYIEDGMFILSDKHAGNESLGKVILITV